MSAKKFKSIKRLVESKVSNGTDRLRASFEEVLTRPGTFLTDAQWSELTGVEYTVDEPEPTEELIRVSVDATGEEFDAIFADGVFITIEDEPQVLDAEKISLVE